LISDLVLFATIANVNSAFALDTKPLLLLFGECWRLFRLETLVYLDEVTNLSLYNRRSFFIHLYSCLYHPIFSFPPHFQTRAATRSHIKSDL